MKQGKISKIEFQLPSKKISINKLCNKNNWDYKNLIQKTGIKNIYRSSSKENALSLALKASKKLKINFKKIDALIYVTQSPQSLIPTTACIIQDKLKLRNDIIAIDITQGCSGYIYGLHNSFSLLNNKNVRNVLLICSDNYTKYISDINKTCVTLFSDAASATLITKSKNEINEFKFLTDGSGSQFVKLIDNYKKKPSKKTPELFMDGRNMFYFALSTVPKIVKKILQFEKKNNKKIKFYIFHQASKLIVDSIIEKLNLPKEKVYINYNKFGNTVSSTIPICIKELIKTHKIRRGDRILVCGFGVGLSAAATILKF